MTWAKPHAAPLMLILALGCSARAPRAEQHSKDFRLPAKLVPIERRAVPKVTDEERVRLTRQLQQSVMIHDQVGVQAALEKGADPNLRLEIPRQWKADLGGFHGKVQATAIAAERNTAAVLEILLQYGGDPNQPAEGPDGLPLQRAIWSAKDEKVLLLFRAGLSVDSRDEEGMTPLDVAIIQLRFDIARELVRCGAVIDKGRKAGLSSRWHICNDVGLTAEQDEDVKMLTAELGRHGQTWDCAQVNAAMEADRASRKEGGR